MAGQCSRDAELEELQGQLSHAEEESSEYDRLLNLLRDDVEEQVIKLRALLDNYSVSEDLADDIKRIANRLEGSL